MKEGAEHGRSGGDVIMTKKNVKIYAHIRGHLKDDNDLRLSVKKEFCKFFKNFGVKALKDADAALLPQEDHMRTMMQYLVSEETICFLSGNICLKDNIDRVELKSQLEELRGEIKLNKHANCTYVVLIIESELHRTREDRPHNHVCIPSLVFGEYQNEVLVESSLV